MINEKDAFLKLIWVFVSGYFGNFAVSVVPSAGISYSRGAGVDAADEGRTYPGPEWKQ